MLILSQDKKIVVNMDNCRYLEVDKWSFTNQYGYGIYADTGTARPLLGIYTSEKKAKEVLQEIIISTINIYTMPGK